MCMPVFLETRRGYYILWSCTHRRLSYEVAVGIKPWSLQEQQVILIAELTLQPLLPEVWSFWVALDGLEITV